MHKINEKKFLKKRRDAFMCVVAVGGWGEWGLPVCVCVCACVCVCVCVCEGVSE